MPVYTNGSGYLDVPAANYSLVITLVKTQEQAILPAHL
jgi:hypothetical protein